MGVWKDRVSEGQGLQLWRDDRVGSLVVAVVTVVAVVVMVAVVVVLVAVVVVLVPVRLLGHWAVGLAPKFRDGRAA